MRYGPIFAVLLVTALPLPAQEPPAFDEAIDVRVVNVEAVVTGRNGERVRGLSRDDFRLLVDGREVQIEFFNEIVDGTMVNGGSAAAGAEPEVVGRSVLVFFDDSFAIRSQRNIVLDQIEASLTRLSPHDQVAVAAFDGKTLVRLADWTSDGKRVSAALAVERARETDGLTPRVHLRMGFTDYGDRMDKAIGAAAAAMRGLPAPPGRKVMLLLTGDWPLIETPTYGSLNGRRTWTNTAGEEMFRPLIDTANLLGYTLYPVDLPGVSTNPGVDADSMRPIAGGGVSSGWELMTDYALNFLAQETGGKAAINSARLEALERMAKDTGTYYWLGFTPNWKANDEHHRIELKPRQRGLRVRARNGFTDLACQAQAFLSEEGAIVSSPCTPPAKSTE